MHEKDFITKDKMREVKPISDYSTRKFVEIEVFPTFVRIESHSLINE